MEILEEDNLSFKESEESVAFSITGRSQSTANLQNIPIHTDESVSIRDAFLGEMGVRWPPKFFEEMEAKYFHKSFEDGSGD